MCPRLPPPPPSGTASRIGGWGFLLGLRGGIGRGCPCSGGVPPPISTPTQVQACRTSHRNGPTGVSMLKPIRTTARVPSAEGSIPCTSGSWNGGSGCSIKYDRSSGRRNPDALSPLSRGQQTPVRLGPRSQQPTTGRRIGLDGAALGPRDGRHPHPQGHGHAAHAHETVHRCFLSHRTGIGQKNNREGAHGPFPAWIRARTERIASLYGVLRS